MKPQNPIALSPDRGKGLLLLAAALPGVFIVPASLEGGGGSPRAPNPRGLGLIGFIQGFIGFIGFIQGFIGLIGFRVSLIYYNMGLLFKVPQGPHQAKIGTLYGPKRYLGVPENRGP